MAAQSPEVTVRRAAAGDPLAARTVRDALRAAGRDHAALAPLLDPLARRAAAGADAALELLLWAVDHLGLAHPAVRRLVLDESAAQDVLQDVLIAVAESVHGYRGDARFTTWLHALARNTAVGHLRRRRETVGLEEVPERGAARISSLIASRVALGAVLEGLPAAYRDPVVLRDVEQLGYDQIGARLGLKPATVRSRVARGRALVAGRLRSP